MAHAGTIAAPAMGQQQSWWQQILIYPALVIALIGAAPTWIEKISSAMNNVPSAKDAREQAAYWKSHAACIAAPFEWSKRTEAAGLRAKVCAPGDVILTHVQPVRGDEYYRWLPLARPSVGPGFGLISEASAQPAPQGQPQSPQPQGTPIRTEQISKREVLVTRQLGNECRFERIDTFTGQVLSRDVGTCPKPEAAARPN